MVKQLRTGPEATFKHTNGIDAALDAAMQFGVIHAAVAVTPQSIKAMEELLAMIEHERNNYEVGGRYWNAWDNVLVRWKAFYASYVQAGSYLER